MWNKKSIMPVALVWRVFSPTKRHKQAQIPTRKKERVGVKGGPPCFTGKLLVGEPMKDKDGHRMGRQTEPTRRVKGFCCAG